MNTKPIRTKFTLEELDGLKANYAKAGDTMDIELWQAIKKRINGFTNDALMQLTKAGIKYLSNVALVILLKERGYNPSEGQAIKEQLT